MLAQTQALTNIDEKRSSGEASTQALLETAPMVQRLGAHRDRVYMAVLELESEKFELQARRDHARQQFEAAERGLKQHIQDIEATLSLYEVGRGVLVDPAKSQVY